MLDKRQIAVWGAGGHAKMVAGIIRRNFDFDVVGFLDDQNSHRVGTEFCGSTVLGGAEQLPQLKIAGIHSLVIAIGENETRLKKAEVANHSEFSFPNLIDPSAIVASDVILGSGVVIAPGAIVNSMAIIGDHVIVNSGAIVEHDCRISEGAHIAPGAIIAGHVTVGRESLIGVGAVIRDRVNIGHYATIGAGATVVHDTPNNTISYGVPARVMRQTSRR